MPDEPLATTQRRLDETLDALRAAAESVATSDNELLAVLRTCESATRRLERATVSVVAALSRRGVFAERGYKSPIKAVADLLGCEQFEARRRVTAAEHVAPRVGLDGVALPARLPATAEVFEAGRASLRHVEVIARVLGSAAAGRLAPEVWAGAEKVLAEKASEYTPASCRCGAPSWSRSWTRTGRNPTTDRPPRSTS